MGPNLHPVRIGRSYLLEKSNGQAGKKTLYLPSLLPPLVLGGAFFAAKVARLTEPGLDLLLAVRADRDAVSHSSRPLRMSGTCRSRTS